MAFSYTINSESTLGGLKIVCGTYTNNSSSTGGDVYTGLSNILYFGMQPKGSSVLANQPVVNETLPLAKDGVTIVTTADEVGTWISAGN